jgi:hypothetical protein
LEADWGNKSLLLIEPSSLLELSQLGFLVVKSITAEPEVPRATDLEADWGHKGLLLIEPSSLLELSQLGFLVVKSITAETKVPRATDLEAQLCCSGLTLTVGGNVLIFAPQFRQKKLPDMSALFSFPPL